MVDTPERTKLDVVAEKFAGYKKNCTGYLARCPAHDDTRPSLTISEGETGKILIHCHTGCPILAILTEVGLTTWNLMPGNKVPVGWYVYHAADGTALYQEVRYFPKSFSMERYQDGFWTPGKGVMSGVPRVPYRLPQLLASPADQEVYIVEGPKDVETLVGWQKIATTNDGGAEKWREEYNQYFKGRHVVLLPDNDAKGWDHVNDIVRNLTGIAASIKVVELPGLPEGGDVTNWKEAGGSLKQLDQLVRKTQALTSDNVGKESPAQPIPVIKIIPVSPPEPGPPPDNVGKENPPTPVQGPASTALVPPKLGDAAYYGIAGEFLKALRPYTEATDAAILAHFLPAVGTIMGPAPHHFAGNKHPPRVFTALVGPTSTGRKGTSFFPVDMLMKKVNADLWGKIKGTGLSSGEGLIAKVSDVEIRNKKTGILESYPSDEKRLYVIEEEFSRVMANMGREGNILSQVMRQAFDSGDIATLTVDPRRATGTHICFVVHTTEEDLEEYFTAIQMANGLGNRFLWFVVRSDKIMAKSVPIPDNVFQPFVDRLKKVVGMEERHVPWSTGAANRWEKEVYASLREDKPGMAGQMLARGNAIVIRLALIYALLDTPKQRMSINEKHLDAALAVWKYSEESVGMLFKSMTGDKLCDKILRLLASGPMAKDGFNRHLSAKQKKGLPIALSNLEEEKRIRKTVVKQVGAGRPSETWESVPVG